MLLRISDVAAALGMSPPTIRKMAELGTLPAVRLGQRSWRIPSEAVDEYLRNLSGGRVNGSAIGLPGVPVAASAPAPVPAAPRRRSRVGR